MITVGAFGLQLHVESPLSTSRYYEKKYPHLKMTHYNLQDHIYISQYREALILLDTKADTYTICSPEFSELLMGLIGGATGAQDIDSIQDLLDDKIVEKKETVYPFYIDRKIDTGWSFCYRSKTALRY